MIYLNSFLICGAICALGQIILENTKLTPAHLNTLFVLLGVILSFFGVYEIILKWGGAGASIPITNFGHLLFKGAYASLKKDGFIGLLGGLFSKGSLGVTVSIISSFLVSLFAKPRH